MQFNNKIRKPHRIISLVPSKTELLADFGLEEEVVGITKFCIHPKLWFKNKSRVGGTKNIDISKIIELQPSLVIANKEENDKEQIERLPPEILVWLSDIKTFEDALQMIKNLGNLLQVQNKANEILTQIKKAKSTYIKKNSSKIRAAYMIWDKPMMVAGGDTYINAMMQLAGFQNVFAHQNRYPTVIQEELYHQKPEVLLLSSEPFPFKQKHLAKYQNILPNSKILLADGTMFSWYGSRLSKAFPYFTTLKNNL